MVCSTVDAENRRERRNYQDGLTNHTQQTSVLTRALVGRLSLLRMSLLPPLWLAVDPSTDATSIIGGVLLPVTVEVVDGEERH